MVIQNETSYTKDSKDFIIEVKNIDILNDVLLVTADVVGLYSSILLEIYLEALRNTLGNGNCKKVPTENLKIAEFVLQNNCF